MFQPIIERLKSREEYIPSNQMWEKPYEADQQYANDVDDLQELIKENELLYRELYKVYELMSHNGIRINGKIEYKSKDKWRQFVNGH